MKMSDYLLAPLVKILLMKINNLQFDCSKININLKLKSFHNAVSLFILKLSSKCQYFEKIYWKFWKVAHLRTQQNIKYNCMKHLLYLNKLIEILTERLIFFPQIIWIIKNTFGTYQIFIPNIWQITYNNLRVCNIHILHSIIRAELLLNDFIC